MLRPAVLVAAALAAGLAATTVRADTVRIAIGHQSTCFDTYTGGIIVKELNLLPKFLPHDGKYKDATYDISFSDYTSGPPITNMMLANKLDIGVMGDYPLIVNGAKFQETDSLRTLYVSGTGYNLKGSGNAVVVPMDSKAYSLADLKGHQISTPVGSAAWGMLLKALQDTGIKTDEITLKDQSPPVGVINIAEKKIDAHADFCPWPEVMEFRGIGRKVLDGSETGVPYLHGVVVRKDWAEQNPELVIAYIQALIAAGQWVEQDPQAAAEALEKWTGIEKEVQYLYFGRGGHLTVDPTIKPQWIKALAYDHDVLAKQRQIPSLNLDQWVTDRYIREAYRRSGLDYDRDQASIVDPAKRTDLTPELWIDGEKIKPFPSNSALLAEIARVQASGRKIDAAYVNDADTHVKLFAKTAFYAGKDNDLTAWLRRSDAEKAGGGKALDYTEALAAVAKRPGGGL